ncbi:hypothetical protein B296_00047475, partial [Ensete ventricosum]
SAGRPVCTARYRALPLGFTNDTPRDYYCNLGPDGRRRDADERPELCRGTVEFVATREYMVDNGRFRLSPLATGRYQPGCALATTRKCEKKQERRRIKRENIGHCRSLIARWRLGFFFATFFVTSWRRLRPENLRTTSRMRRTSRGGDFFAVVFSSSPSQVIRKRGGLDDVAEPSPHPCCEEKTRRCRLLF